MPDGIVECCQRFVNAKPQKIDVIEALITTAADAPATEANDHPKFATRIFLNEAEIGVGAEIIDRSKRIRDKIKSRFISTISGIIATVPTYESNLCEVSRLWTPEFTFEDDNGSSSQRHVSRGRV